MAWLLPILIALVTAVAAAFTSGYVAYNFVQWFHISSRDGGDGYMIILIGLVGGILGFITGMITPRFVTSLTSGPGFCKAAGMSFGIILAVVGVAALGGWLVADIPPTVDGHLLILDVEFRLPADAPDPSQYPEKDSYILLASSPAGSHTVRKSERGFLKIAQAAQQDGRWVIPGSVQIFTTRGQRSVMIFLGGQGSGFFLPLARRPGHRYDQWSEWLPRTTDMSYRFRVRPILPAPPPPPHEEVVAAEFAALASDAPLEKWLSFLTEDAPEVRRKAILKVLDERHAELAAAIRSKDDREAEDAMHAVAKLTAIHPDIDQAVRYVATDVAADIRRFNAMKPDDPGYVDLGARIRGRFNDWHRAWWTVHHLTGADGRPPVEELLALAKVHSDDGFMQEVILNAEAHLGG